MSDTVTFPSECPHCHAERMQTGYVRDELVQLMKSGAELEAYCSSCDEYWPVSVEERADLARALKV